MPAINLSAFSGETPLIIPRLLPETAATEAFNARLDDGALTPINKSQKTGSFVPHGTKTIYRHNGQWLNWPDFVNVAPAPVAEDRLYFTGQGKPKIIVDGDTMNLAVPRPIGAINASVIGTGTGDIITRTYVYTFVTAHGEESAPSPASNLIDWKSGQTLTITGFQAAPADRAITKQRIYRSQTGSSGTYFYFIAERSASASDFVDTVAVDAFQEALPSIGWDEPADSLTGLTSMSNGMMAAFSGKEVYFCEPWRPHAWPQRYSMLCDSPIVAIEAIGDVLVVMTTAQPYIMAGSHPDSIQSVKLRTNHPCVNGRGVVNLGHIVVYPSHEGLIAIGPDGSISNLTQSLFRRHDWQALSPTTIVGAQYGGAYALFYDVTKYDVRDAGCIFIYPGGTPFIIRSSEIAATSYYDVSDSALYFMRPNDTNIYVFDPKDGAPERLTWRSKEWWLPRPMNFGVIKVERAQQKQESFEPIEASERESINIENQRIFAEVPFESALNAHALNVYPVHDDPLLDLPSFDSLQVEVFGDGTLIGTTNILERPVRLHSSKMYSIYEISVSTTVPISRIVLASTINELRSLV